MYYLADTEGYIGDYGNTEILNRIKEISNSLNLKEQKVFINQGFHIKSKTLVKELESVNFNFTELADIMQDIIVTIKKAKEIVILTTNID